MRWTYHQEGERRVRHKFAWLPIRHRGNAYWLETVELHEQYHYSVLGSCYFWWVQDVRPL